MAVKDKKRNKADAQTAFFSPITVKVKTDFARSTNLKTDFEDSKSLNHLIMSEKFQSFFQRLSEPLLHQDSNQRVHVLSGTPGVGKSTFSVFFTRLISKNEIKKIDVQIGKQKTSKEFKESLKNMAKVNKFLPVFLNGDEGQIEDAFYQALSRTCAENGLESQFKSATEENAKSAISILQTWRKEYPSKVKELEEKLESDYNTDAKNLEASLRRGSRPALKIFGDAYRDVTGGASFTQFHHGQIVELYKSVAETIKKKGFAGIYIVYDEFGKYLERGARNIKDFDLQFIQDLAEAANKSGANHLHLLLITHLPISQYATKLPVAIQQEWSKIEGRFEQMSFNDGAVSTYSVLASVFETDLASQSIDFNKLVKKNVEGWLSKNKQDSSLKLYKQIEDLSAVVTTCYPLHPLSLALLPLLSEKIAQNERTLFSFLSRDEENSLTWFLKKNPMNDDAVQFLTPKAIYDYFRPLIANDVGIGGACRIGLVVDTVLNDLSEDDVAAREIVCLIGMASIINNKSVFNVTQDNIGALLDGVVSASAVSTAIKKLVDARQVLLDRAKGDYQIFEGSSVDLREEIAKVRHEKLTAEGYLRVLSSCFSTGFLTPKKYNFERGITRYFREALTSVDQLTAGMAGPDFTKEDGAVYYLVPFNEEELELARDQLMTMNLPATAFVVPNHSLDIEAELLEIHAIDQIFSKKEIISSGPNVRKELNHYRKQAEGILMNALRVLYSQYDMQASVFYKSEVISESVQGLSDVSMCASQICESEYPKYPEFSNEMINKHRASNPVIQGRNRLLDVLSKVEEKNFGIEGHGPEYSIMRALMRANRFDITNGEISGLKKGSALCALFQDFNEYLASENGKPKTIESLLQRWQRPPFGVREALVSLYLAIFHRLTESPVSYYQSDVYVGQIDTQLFENLLKQPKKYALQLIPLSKEIRSHLQSVTEIFCGYIPNEKAPTEVGFLPMAKIIAKFYQLIPEYSRRHLSNTARQKRLVAALDSLAQPEKFALMTLPAVYEVKDIGSLSVANRAQFYADLKSDLGELFEIYISLVKRLAKNFNASLSEFTAKLSRKEAKAIPAGAPLAQLWKAAVDQMEGAAKTYPYSQSTLMFLNRINQISPDMVNQFVIETLSDALTSQNPKFWNDKGESLCYINLRQAISELLRMNYLFKSGNQNIVSISAFDNNGQPVGGDIIHERVSEDRYQTLSKEIKLLLAKLTEAERNDVLIRLLIEPDAKENKVSKITNRIGIGEAWG